MSRSLGPEQISHVRADIAAVQPLEQACGHPTDDAARRNVLSDHGVGTYDAKVSDTDAVPYDSRPRADIHMITDRRCTTYGDIRANGAVSTNGTFAVDKDANSSICDRSPFTNPAGRTYPAVVQDAVQDLALRRRRDVTFVK
nr:hypothetical protein [uncultured Brachybacterium sp.]